MMSSFIRQLETIKVLIAAKADVNLVSMVSERHAAKFQYLKYQHSHETVLLLRGTVSGEESGT